MEQKWIMPAVEWEWAMLRLASRVLAAILALLIGILVTSSPVAAQSSFEFKLGFAELASKLPTIVGQPLENEHHNPATGDTLQRTTTGLMVWRKTDSWTAFTNGSRTWVNGPNGVQERSNEERFAWEAQARDGGAGTSSPGERSVLANNLLVTWYGNPHTGLMGVLGQFSGDDLAGRLRRQAEAYGPYTDKEILPAYHLVAVVAQAGPGADGLWRRRESPEVIDSMLEQARTHGFRLVLDIQVGHSRVGDELEYLRPWLEEPDVHLALDPEFDMGPGQVPGQALGHTMASEVNQAIGVLEEIITSKALPPKVLIVHQFTLSMLPDKERIGDSPVVDVVLDMDGFGSQPLKLDSYRAVMARPLEFAGIKLFYDQDTGLFSPSQVMGLDPVPAVVIYQ